MKDSELNFIRIAVEAIKQEICSKMLQDNIMVYKCGAIIRIDINNKGD